jgi:hypothetical protein
VTGYSQLSEMGGFDDRDQHLSSFRLIVIVKPIGSELSTPHLCNSSRYSLSR